MSQLTIPLNPSGVYHIYNHANGKDNLFNSFENYNYFLRKYTKYIFPIAETYAYCLMPNHLHLMIWIHDADVLVKYFFEKKKKYDFNDILSMEDTHKATVDELHLPGLISQQFSNLFNSYTKSINKRYKRRGSLFNQNFKRVPVESESYFTRLITYIHNNPVNHGFVKEIGHWPHSSWHSYISDKPTKIKREAGLDWFGGREGFINFHKNILTEREIKKLEPAD